MCSLGISVGLGVQGLAFDFGWGVGKMGLVSILGLEVFDGLEADTGE